MRKTLQSNRPVLSHESLLLERAIRKCGVYITWLVDSYKEQRTDPEKLLLKHLSVFTASNLLINYTRTCLNLTSQS